MYADNAKSAIQAGTGVPAVAPIDESFALSAAFRDHPRTSAPNRKRSALRLRRSVRRVDPHDILAQRRLTRTAAVEHVAARIALDLHAALVAHDRHLVDDQHRCHERAG